MNLSCERFFGILAPAGPLAKGTDFERLYALAEAVLHAIESKKDSTQVTQKAKNDLHHLSVTRQQRWRDFLDAQKLKAGKTSGADYCLSEIRAAASSVRREPGLHEDIRRFVDALTDEILALEAEYRNYKGDRGLLDFTDLEVLFLQLLQEPKLVDNLSKDFDWVVVDEFQDTNPLQLAIFQRLNRWPARTDGSGTPNSRSSGSGGPTRN